MKIALLRFKKNDNINININITISNYDICMAYFVTFFLSGRNGFKKTRIIDLSYIKIFLCLKPILKDHVNK